MEPKNIWAVVATIGVFAFVGLILLFVFKFGPGRVFVMVPDGSVATVGIDGKAGVKVTPHMPLSVGQGRHTLNFVVDGQKSDVVVNLPNGFANLVASPPGHCFAELDVTESNYSRNGTHPPPTVLASFAGEQGYPLTGVPAFSEKELPKSINENSRQTLVVDMPCQYVGHSGMEVLMVTGLN